MTYRRTRAKRGTDVGRKGILVPKEAAVEAERRQFTGYL